ncbi:hypothetical protein ACYSNU_04325 [Enterococcus sp. LJL120]
MSGEVSCWEVLGISETSNQRAIKKAYAKLLKSLDLESQVSEFQKLKRALDEALVLAKAVASDDEVTESTAENFFDDLVISETTGEAEEPEISHESYGEKSELHPPFSQRFLALLNQKAYFADLAAWRELLEINDAATIEDMMAKQEMLLNFLGQNFMLLSHEIRLYLIDYCQAEDQNSLSTIPQGMLTFIKDYPDFGFDFWQEIAPEYRETYFSQRDQVFQLISSKVPLAALSARVQSCLDIYEGDSLVYLLAAYLFVLDDFRLQNGANLNQLQLLLSKGNDDHQWRYLKDYLLFVMEARAQGTAARASLLEKADFFYQTPPKEVPLAVYRLTSGYVAFLLSNHEAARKCWYAYENTYRLCLNPREREFIKPVATKNAVANTNNAAETSSNKSNWTWGIVLAVIIIRLLSRMF